MPRPLARRIARLEKGSTAECQVGGPGAVTYEVVVPEAIEVLSKQRDAPKPPQCPSCGRLTGVWVFFPEARGVAVET